MGNQNLFSRSDTENSLQTGVLWAKRGEENNPRLAQCSSRASRKMPRSPRLAHKGSVMHDTQKILLQMKDQSLLTLSRWVGKVWLSFLILEWHSLLILLSGSINLTPPPSYPPLPSPPPSGKQSPSLTLEYTDVCLEQYDIGLVWIWEGERWITGSIKLRHMIPGSLWTRSLGGYWRKREQTGRE